MKLFIKNTLLLGLIIPIFLHAQTPVDDKIYCSISEIDSPLFENVELINWSKCKTNLTTKFDEFSSSSFSSIGDVAAIKYLKVDSNWVAFAPGFSSKKLYRLEYGKSLINTPKIVDLGNFSGLLNSPHRIDFCILNGINYAVVTNYSTGTIIGLKFLDGLLSPPEALLLTEIPNIPSAISISIHTENQQLKIISHSAANGKIYTADYTENFDNFIKSSENPGLISGVTGHDIFVTDTAKFLAIFGNSGQIRIIKYKTEPINFLSSHIGNAANSITNGLITPTIDGFKIFGNTNGNFFAADYNISKNIIQNVISNFSNVNTGTSYAIDFIQENDNNFVIIPNFNRLNILKNNPICKTSGWVYTEFIGYNKTVDIPVVIIDSVYVLPPANPKIVTNKTCTSTNSELSDSEKLLFEDQYSWIWKINSTVVPQNESKINFTFNSEGENTIELKVKNTCNDSISTSQVLVVVSDKDIITNLKTADTLCTFSDIIVSNTSTFKKDSIASNSWLLLSKNLDTLSSQVSSSFTYSFSVTDTFLLRLQNIGKSGCIADTTIQLIPLQGPKSSFEILNYCLNDSTIIQENSGETDISKLEWYFDDSLFSSEKKIKLLNDTYFNKEIRLITFNELGCKSNSQKTLQIAPNPIADFDSTFFCTNQSKQILNRSTIEDFTTLTYNWYLNDSLVSTQINPNINFGYGTNKNLKLVVSSTENCKDSSQKQLSILENPTADFIYSPPCLKEKIEFQDRSTSANGSIISRKWTVNQAILNGLKPNYILQDTGSYPVTLEVTNSFSCKSYKTDTIQINALPIVSFVYDNACVGKEMNFYNQSSVKNETITSARWSFIGLGSILAGDTVSYIYQNANTNLVQLEVTTNNGCKNSLIQSVSAKPSAVSNFTIDNDFGPPSLNVKTSNSSQNATFYQWLNQDGEVLSTDFEPNLSFDEYGVYTLSLIAISEDFCKDTSNIIITVEDFINQVFVSNLQSQTSGDETSFNFLVSNNGNQTLKSLDFLMDFGGLMTQKQTISLNIEPNQSTTINLPIALEAEFLKSLPYLCISSTENEVMVSENTCIIIQKGVKNLGIYPSPAQDYITLDIYTPESQEISIKLYNIFGETVLSHNVESSISGKNSITLSLKDLTKDIYFVSISSGAEVIIEKILKN